MFLTDHLGESPLQSLSTDYRWKVVGSDCGNKLWFKLSSPSSLSRRLSSHIKMPSDENDWLFDFVLQFLESDLFDAAVMDFVDEKCDIFDNEDENKFAYTDIHAEFREHVDALLSSNLGELGVTPELFYEACAKGRNARDINRTVYDRMIAMDDFQTFKELYPRAGTLRMWLLYG